MKNKLIVDVIQGVHFVRSERYATLLKKVKQGLKTNEERLMLIKVWRSDSLRARMRLVIAMRLQVQQPSFLLCSSSNTPSVLMNVA
jgi:hypothetical protein